MTKLLIILFVALAFETTGVVMLSKGVRGFEGPKNFSAGELGQVVLRAVTNPYIVFGVIFEAAFFLGLLMMMSSADLSFVWPLTALTFVFSTFAAKVYLHEEIDFLRWVGVILIVVGAILIGVTEKKKERQTSASSSEAARLG